MAFFKELIGRRGREEMKLGILDRGQNEAGGESTEVVDVEALFDDFENEGERMREWWIGGGAEEEKVERESEVEVAEGANEVKQDAYDLIHSLMEETYEEEEELSIALKKAIEGMGKISSAELLELGRTALRELEVGNEVDAERTLLE